MSKASCSPTKWNLLLGVPMSMEKVLKNHSKSYATMWLPAPSFNESITLGNINYWNKKRFISHLPNSYWARDVSLHMVTQGPRFFPFSGSAVPWGPPVICIWAIEEKIDLLQLEPYLLPRSIGTKMAYILSMPIPLARTQAYGHI